MAETRARPARERQRAGTYIASELWFWRRMIAQEHPSGEMMEEWRSLSVSTRIRRFMAAVTDGDEIAVGEWESTPAAMSQIQLHGDAADEHMTETEAYQNAHS